MADRHAVKKREKRKDRKANGETNDEERDNHRSLYEWVVLKNMRRKTVGLQEEEESPDKQVTITTELRRDHWICSV